MAGKQKSFLEFVEDYRLPMFPDEWDFGRRVRHTQGQEYTFLKKDLSGVVDSFDFAPFFPVDNGEEPPYYRIRRQVDRNEAGMYFFYRRYCKKFDLEDEGFVPFPPPTKKQIIASQADGWPFE